VQEIITYAEELNCHKKKNLRFSLVTNLTQMDDAKLTFLKQHKVGLCTSLDGPEEVHDTHRKYVDGRGSHGDVVRWIERIKKNERYPLEALMVTTKHSRPYAKEIIDEYVRLGFDHIQLRPFLNLGYAKDNRAALGFNAQEYIHFWTQAMDHLLKLNKDRFLSDRFATHILRKLFLRRNAQFVDLNSPCGAAISTLAYDHTGAIYSCDEGRQYDLFRLGSVDQEYPDLFESGQTQSLIRASVNDCTYCDRCVWKPFCGLCPVCSFADSGNLVPILSKNDRCRILDAQFTYLMEKIQEDRHTETFLRWIRNI
jgi:radical SAM protein with 4Fe4S-binding SPASM domain